MSSKKSSEKTELEETSEKVINKIFLIGNGFDLSLKLKTKYEDFLLWYFKGFISKCFLKPYIQTDSGRFYNYHDDELFAYYNKDNREFGAKFLAYSLKAQDSGDT